MPIPRIPQRRVVLGFSCVLLLGAIAVAHAEDKPPKVVTPPPSPSLNAKPPADAVVLFDGKRLDGWVHGNGKAAKWVVKDGTMVCKPGSGSIISKQKHGDFQLHVEFATPLMPDASGQGRGNSGVYIQGRYEIQVLDSFKNNTYADGSCGALYKQYAPLVNACLPPEQWQTYDITFHAPTTDANGKVVKKGRLTVLHNGVKIHDNIEIMGLTGGSLDNKEGGVGPIMLQDHGNTVRFRNIWYRPLTGDENKNS